MGSWTVLKLLECGLEVAVVDNLSTGCSDYVPAQAQLYQVDVRDEPSLLEVFKTFRPTHVLHAASDVSGRLAGCAEIVHSAQVNVAGSVNVLKVMLEVNCQKLVFASSAAVYGDMLQGQLALEDWPLRPQSPYGASKAAFEMLLVPLMKSGSIDVAVLRYANVYGPRQQKGERGGVVPIFFDQILSGEPVLIYGHSRTPDDGGCSRDYITVTDVVNANVLCITSGLTGVFNVSTGVSHSTKELLAAIALELGCEPKTNWAPKRDGEIEFSAQDPRKLIKAGWTAPLSLAAGLSLFRSAFETQFKLTAR